MFCSASNTNKLLLYFLGKKVLNNKGCTNKTNHVNLTKGKALRVRKLVNALLIPRKNAFFSNCCESFTCRACVASWKKGFSLASSKLCKALGKKHVKLYLRSRSKCCVCRIAFVGWVTRRFRFVASCSALL